MLIAILIKVSYVIQIDTRAFNEIANHGGDHKRCYTDFNTSYMS